ncbi:hypothetical protein PH505_dd00100 [Pseudoalteromonas distincta]|nr:hypothetical protein PH505_dd00100 [Pseudoalteromonas distincta]
MCFSSFFIHLSTCISIFYALSKMVFMRFFVLKQFITEVNIRGVYL